MLRRDFLQQAVASGTVLTIGSQPKKAKNLKVAFITDVHLEPAEKVSSDGLSRVLQKVQEQKPDLILNGGDTIFDSLRRDKSETDKQWKLWKNHLDAASSPEIRSCIGNHDIWGWFLNDPDAARNAAYGKQWAIEELKLPAAYYSFDKGGWHFIVLDSIQQDGDHYIAKIDPLQLEWLAADLQENASKNTCVLSHVPITSFCWQFAAGENATNEDLVKLKRGVVMNNALSLKNLFYKYPNVKLSLSGHLHMQEELDYLGVKYLSCGAVSGNWWKGDRFEFKPSFTMLELGDDGSVKHTFVPY